MYVHIVSFKVKAGDDLTFIEGQKFEEMTEGKPFGLNHYHIYKDLNEEHRYYLIEYWDSKADKEKLEQSQEHQEFHKLRNTIIEKKIAQHECEQIV